MCTENPRIKQTQTASRSRDVVIAKDQKGACDLVVGQATNAETWMQKCSKIMTFRIEKGMRRKVRKD